MKQKTLATSGFDTYAKTKLIHSVGALLNSTTSQALTHPLPNQQHYPNQHLLLTCSEIP